MISSKEDVPHKHSRKQGKSINNTSNNTSLNLSFMKLLDKKKTRMEKMHYELVDETGEHNLPSRASSSVSSNYRKENDKLQFNRLQASMRGLTDQEIDNDAKFNIGDFLIKKVIRGDPQAPFLKDKHVYPQPKREVYNEKLTKPFIKLPNETDGFDHLKDK